MWQDVLSYRTNFGVVSHLDVSSLPNGHDVLCYVKIEVVYCTVLANPCLTVQYGGILVGEAVSGHFQTLTGVGKCCGGYFDQDSCHQVYFKLTMQRSGAGNRRLRVAEATGMPHKQVKFHLFNLTKQALLTAKS